MSTNPYTHKERQPVDGIIVPYYRTTLSTPRSEFTWVYQYNKTSPSKNKSTCGREPRYILRRHILETMMAAGQKNQ